MYYKITNTKSTVYTKLFKLRTTELEIRKENSKQIEEKVVLKFTNYLGDNSQFNWGRVPYYHGFMFHEPNLVDKKIWKEHPEHKGIFIPNKRTKRGLEMSDFLRNGLRKSNLFTLLEILKLSSVGKFHFPFVEIAGRTILLNLSNNHEPKNKNVIEITKTEFEEILNNN